MTKNILEIGTLSAQFANPWINLTALQTVRVLLTWGRTGLSLTLCLSCRDPADPGAQSPAGSSVTPGAAEKFLSLAHMHIFPWLPCSGC